MQNIDFCALVFSMYKSGNNGENRYIFLLEYPL